ncbi:hypothetical protein BV898_18848 [Hypsibius exemplaris]|uniref:Uncharacterized protein n=1 Tax=Hypsibius exemplaris TaxID=2072580 RepID=A0A9X6NI81_HYPEX|nr:hypothetical protein BV898_18848 [Hypsibius exemplaris]
MDEIAVDALDFHETACLASAAVADCFKVEGVSETAAELNEDTASEEPESSTIVIEEVSFVQKNARPIDTFAASSPTPLFANDLAVNQTGISAFENWFSFEGKSAALAQLYGTALENVADVLSAIANNIWREMSTDGHQKWTLDSADSSARPCSSHAVDFPDVMSRICSSQPQCPQTVTTAGSSPLELISIPALPDEDKPNNPEWMQKKKLNVHQRNFASQADWV